MAFPTFDRPPTKIELMIKVPVLKAESSAGYMMQARKNTRIVRSWNVSYGSKNLLNQTDTDTLIAYFENNAGLSFDWLNTDDNVTYTVYFDSDSLSIRNPHFGMPYYEVSFTLREV